tara:strand:+ start:1476 stop:1778 length:303 start_codon:yes stop_codon:yes gene_type:complete
MNITAVKLSIEGCRHIMNEPEEGEVPLHVIATISGEMLPLLRFWATCENVEWDELLEFYDELDERVAQVDGEPKLKLGVSNVIDASREVIILKLYQRNNT